MKVVFVFEYFAKQMGYLANCLPKYMAREGVEVHVITTDLPPYYTLPSFTDTYATFLASSRASANTRELLDGFTLHTLPHTLTRGIRSRIGNCQIEGLKAKITELTPDIVQSWSVQGWVPLDLARINLTVPFKFFTANHIHASVCPLANPEVSLSSRHRWEHSILRKLPARLAASRSLRCYCISEDCADIAIRFYGTSEKTITIAPLGTDTDFFRPIHDNASKESRLKFRHTHGIGDSDILCVYTGRLTEDKNPLLLAESVAQLRREGLPYRCLFVGSGPQREDISKCEGSHLIPLLPFCELGDIYRASDVGVWPMQESMSMIDAAACGIPIIVNDAVTTKERIADNGLTYKAGDLTDLCRTLKILGAQDLRNKLGSAGAKRIPQELGWNVLAKKRIKDYECFL